MQVRHSGWREPFWLSFFFLFIAGRSATGLLSESFFAFYLFGGFFSMNTDIDPRDRADSTAAPFNLLLFLLHRFITSYLNALVPFIFLAPKLTLRQGLFSRMSRGLVLAYLHSDVCKRPLKMASQLHLRLLRIATDFLSSPNLSASYLALLLLF